MEQYTRAFMRQAEAERPAITDDGTPTPALRWFAAVHYNTEHPHAHIVIRGLDVAGNEVILPSSFISHDLRAIATDIATKELGPRTREEIQQQREQEIVAERFTSLDHAIRNQINPFTNEVESTEPILVRRLDYLADTNEAEWLSPGTYRLKEGWDRDLRRKGERGDILKSLFTDMHENPPEERHIYIYRASWTVEGTGTFKGMEEEREEPYALVTREGRAYYYRGSEAEHLSIGDRVRLEHGTPTILQTRQHAIPDPTELDQGRELSIRPPSAHKPGAPGQNRSPTDTGS